MLYHSGHLLTRIFRAAFAAAEQVHPGHAKLGRIASGDQFVSSREAKEKIYRRYEQGFKGLPLKMNPYLKDTRPNFWLSCMLINKDAIFFSIIFP